MLPFIVRSSGSYVRSVNAKAHVLDPLARQFI